MASSRVKNDSLVPVQKIYLPDYLNRWFTLHITDSELLKKLSSRIYGKTYPIEQYPCRVYLVDCVENERVRVWLNEREAEVTTCSDYITNACSSNNMKPCWVCKWIDVDPRWCIDVNEEIDPTSINKPDFYRLHGDRMTEFGDGGAEFLVYPVWIQETLPVSEHRRERLLDALHRLNEQRKDFHPAPSPVEDIIDPDLLPYRPESIFNRERWIARKERSLAHEDREKRQFRRDIEQGRYDDLSEHEQIRNTYQWVPSEFLIKTNNHVDIRTPIHNLPPIPENRKTYGDIAQVFYAMLPMFEKLKLIRLNCDQEQRLQVIVKAQSYNLKAGMKYSGRWHVEGHTENIIAAGVYYLHIDERLTGGTLKFRPAVAPGKEYESIEIDHTVSSLQTGAAVVFSNAIPHRFQQIQNLTTDDGCRRTFLNFFIVDPAQPILMKSNSIVLSPKDVIITTLREWNGGKLPDLVLEKILELLNDASIWETEAEAKQFRAQVRKAMVDEKTGWGYIHWGNCGITEFVPALCSWPPRKREEIYGALEHTESD